MRVVPLASRVESELKGKEALIITFWDSFELHEASHRSKTFQPLFKKVLELCENGNEEIAYEVLWSGKAYNKAEAKAARAAKEKFADVNKKNPPPFGGGFFVFCSLLLAIEIDVLALAVDHDPAVRSLHIIAIWQMDLCAGKHRIVGFFRIKDTCGQPINILPDDFESSIGDPDQVRVCRVGATLDKPVGEQSKLPIIRKHLAFHVAFRELSGISYQGTARTVKMLHSRAHTATDLSVRSKADMRHGVNDEAFAVINIGGVMAGCAHARFATKRQPGKTAKRKTIAPMLFGSRDESSRKSRRDKPR